MFFVASTLQQEMEFSDFIVYVDESGSPELKTIDPNYPCFVLSFCVFRKCEYVQKVVPLIQELKFRWWGHDSVILHTVDIKRERGDFTFLQYKPKKELFLEDLNEVLVQAPFVLIAAIIDKQKLKERYLEPFDPYCIALGFCMERCFRLLADQGAEHQLTTIVVEERGRNEDRDLELEFRRIVEGKNKIGPMPNLNLRFCSKKANSRGLQIADLVSTPIGRNYLKPDQPNRGYAILATKFRSGEDGNFEGLGRKVFP